MTQFAGFDYPKVTLFTNKSLPERLQEFKQHHKLHPFCGPYYRNEPAPNATGMSFYLDSDFAPGLRWKWCDEVEGVRIRHTGWYTDEYGDSDTIRGIVFRLPHNRGFLAGTSMGEGMASYVEYTIYEDETDAARDADDLAKQAAEKEREYQEKEREKEDQESDLSDDFVEDTEQGEI